MKSGKNNRWRDAEWTGKCNGGGDGDGGEVVVMAVMVAKQCTPNQPLRRLVIIVLI